MDPNLPIQIHIVNNGFVLSQRTKEGGTKTLVFNFLGYATCGHDDSNIPTLLTFLNDLYKDHPTK